MLSLFRFFRSMEKTASDVPKWGQDDFFLLIQTLPTFWAERIWILRNFINFIFSSYISGFPGPQTSKSLDAGAGAAGDGLSGQLVAGYF